MSRLVAILGARIFDGEAWHRDAALLVRDGRVEAVGPAVPREAELVRLDGGLLSAGFVDLQVNGGGGVMLNERQDAATIRTICEAHRRYGTTALLPTLITDTPAVTVAAVEAGAEAARLGVAGFAGLHLEGPHLSQARKGAHDPGLIRPMTDADEAFLVAARRRLPALLVTVAPESVTPERIGRLPAAGIVVSLGHSDTTREVVGAAADAGATMVTHLFNAMSQIGNREPGVAGAAIADGRLHAGLIADGIHVDPATIGIALRAKQGPGRIFLVTDAMATIGTDMTSFTLNGRLIRREGGSLRLSDGTLAGADLDMISAVRFVHRSLGVELAEALNMASLYPAEAMGIQADHGRLVAGSRADFVHLSEELDVKGVWVDGEQAVAAA